MESKRSGLDLYFTPGSAPSRMVLLTAAALDVKLNLIHVNLWSKEQLKPEYLKINPQHTVPTLVDGDFILWESRAICRYLCNRFGEHSSLYPKDPKLRAMVDQKLDFDIGTLYPRFASYFYPQIFAGTSAHRGLLKLIHEVLALFDRLLEGRTYAACDHITLADLSLVATVSTIEAASIEILEYKNILRWYELVKSTATDYERSNAEGARQFKIFTEHVLKLKSDL